MRLLRLSEFDINDIQSIYGRSPVPYWARSCLIAESVILERQRSQAFAGRSKNGIAECRNHGADRRLANPAPETTGRHEDALDLWCFRQTQYAIIREIALHHPTLVDGDFL